LLLRLHRPAALKIIESLVERLGKNIYGHMRRCAVENAGTTVQRRDFSVARTIMKGMAGSYDHIKYLEKQLVLLGGAPEGEGEMLLESGEVAELKRNLERAKTRNETRVATGKIQGKINFALGTAKWLKNIKARIEELEKEVLMGIKGARVQLDEEKKELKRGEAVKVKLLSRSSVYVRTANKLSELRKQLILELPREEVDLRCVFSMTSGPHFPNSSFVRPLCAPRQHEGGGERGIVQGCRQFRRHPQAHHQADAGGGQDREDEAR
jgi:hypothetical protein